MFEQWRDVPGWCGKYQVSDCGNVRSFASKSGGRTHEPAPMLVQTQRNGYLLATFWRGPERERHLVHRLVLTTFRGPCPQGFQGSHANGIRSDNRLENLRWLSCRENHQDKKAHGTWQCGEKHGNHKLTEAAVLEIRSSTSPAKELAKKFGVVPKTIWGIRKGKEWKHSAAEAQGRA